MFLQDVGGGSEVGGAGGGGAPQLVIWGTDVDVNRCKERFKRFLERYIDPTVEQDEKFDGMDVDEPIYLQRLEEVSRRFTYLISLNELLDSTTVNCISSLQCSLWKVLKLKRLKIVL